MIFLLRKWAVIGVFAWCHAAPRAFSSMLGLADDFTRPDGMVPFLTRYDMEVDEKYLWD
jgi:hypothetical protein